MNLVNRQLIANQRARAGQRPSAVRVFSRNRVLLLATCLMATVCTTAQSQWTAQGNQPVRQEAQQPLVELLPPTFDIEPPTQPSSHSSLSAHPRVSANADRPPQQIEKIRGASANRRRPSKSHIEQISHTPASAVQLPTSGDGVASSIVRSQPLHSANSYVDDSSCDECVIQERSWQILPSGLMYKSYLAGEKEPRMAAVWLYEQGRGWVWETTLGGRIGLVRYGTRDAINPQGWQVDLEGAAFPRIDPEESSEMDAVDFRAGFVSTWRTGPLAVKAGYYHISSHIGDEYLLRNPTFPRIEYVRDSAIFGMTYDINPALKTYGEVGYAVGHTGGAEPLEFQFGLEYSPRACCSWRGAPFAAINGHLREDFDFGGNLNIVAGRQWRGPESDHLFRAGFMYFNGKSLQYQFFNKHEELLGAGIWFDF